MPDIPRSGRFTVILAVVAIAAILIMSGVLLWQLRGQELRHAEAEAISLSHIIAEQTSRSFQSIDLALDIALDRLDQAGKLGLGLDEFAVHAMLRSRIVGMPQLRSVFIVDNAGRIRSSALSHPPPSFDVSDRDYFLALRNNPSLDRHVGAPVSNRVDNKRTVFLARRVPAARGRPPAIIVASLDLDYLVSLYDSIRLDRVGGISLFLNHGTLVAGASTEGSLRPAATVANLLKPAFESAAESATIRRNDDPPGIWAVRKVGNYPMSVVISVSDGEALASWQNTAKLILIGVAANVFLMSAATILLLRRLRHEEELEAAAIESNARLRAMVDSAMDAIVTIDSDSRVVVFNPAAQSMFGYTEQEIIGQPIDRLIPARHRIPHSENIAAFRTSGVSKRAKESRIEIVGLRADGTEFPLESTIARVSIGGQEMFTAILRDIGDRRRAETELRESHRQLRELASSLQAIREEERTSIARELHDELGQQLLRLRMDLSWLSGRTKNALPAVQDKVADMKLFIDGTVDALRRVTTRLRPPLLDELGLAEAARWQLDDFSARTGILVTASIAITDCQLDDQIPINVFRILQESLTNVARHADATEVSVTLSTSGQELSMMIQDNGKGANLGDSRMSGHGLIGIRERTLLLGGTTEIGSAPGCGFALTVRIPLPSSASQGSAA